MPEEADGFLLFSVLVLAMAAAAAFASPWAALAFVAGGGLFPLFALVSR